MVGRCAFEDQTEFDTIAKGGFPQESFDQVVSISAEFIFLFVGKDVGMIEVLDGQSAHRHTVLGRGTELCVGALKCGHQPDFVNRFALDRPLDDRKVMVIDGIKIGTQQAYALFSVEFLVDIDPLFDAIEGFADQLARIPTALIAEL